MRDRLIIYGVILIIVYVGLQNWNQKEVIIYLRDIVAEQQLTVKKQRQLIDAQEDYIKVLEGYQSPIHGRGGNPYKDPI